MTDALCHASSMSDNDNEHDDVLDETLGGSSGKALGDDGRKAVRRLKNRESARKVRARRITEVKDLQSQIAALSSDNKSLTTLLAQIQGQMMATTSRINELTTKYEAVVVENHQLRNDLSLSQLSGSQLSVSAPFAPMVAPITGLKRLSSQSLDASLEHLGQVCARASPGAMSYSRLTGLQDQYGSALQHVSTLGGHPTRENSGISSGTTLAPASLARQVSQGLLPPGMQLLLPAREAVANAAVAMRHDAMRHTASGTPPLQQQHVPLQDGAAQPLRYDTFMMVPQTAVHQQQLHHHHQQQPQQPQQPQQQQLQQQQQQQQVVDVGGTSYFMQEAQPAALYCAPQQQQQQCASTGTRLCSLNEAPEDGSADNNAALQQHLFAVYDMPPLFEQQQQHAGGQPDMLQPHRSHHAGLWHPTPAVAHHAPMQFQECGGGEDHHARSQQQQQQAAAQAMLWQHLHHSHSSAPAFDPYGAAEGVPQAHVSDDS